MHKLKVKHVDSTSGQWYKLITKVASISKGKMDSTNPEKLIMNLAKWGHHVPFEFIHLTTLVQAPKTTIAQMIRHRGFGVVEQSFRYTEPIYAWEYKEYQKILQETGDKELARKHLTLGTINNAYFTGNLRTWAHFIKLRRTPHAENDIRYITKGIEEIIKTKCELTYLAIINNISMW